MRGSPSTGPLFTNLDRAKKGGRLTPSGLYKLVRKLARCAGVQRRVSPHRLRHSAITSALDDTGGDIRRVASFARHAKIETTALYDDRRKDVGREIAALLAESLGSAAPAAADAQAQADKPGSDG